MGVDVFDTGLPASLEAERLILGCLLTDASHLPAVQELLKPEDFSVEKHRRIFARMVELADQGQAVDRVTLATELQRHNQLESVDGVGYIVSLDEGLPQVYNVESYVRIVREKSDLRRVIFAAQNVLTRALVGEETAEEILARMENLTLNGAQNGRAELLSVGQVIDRAGGMDAFLKPGRAGRGYRTPWAKLTELTAGFRAGEVFVVAGNTSMGKTSAALQIGMTVAEETGGVLLFSLEMSREALVERMLCMAGRVDGHKYRAGYLNADERRRLCQATNLLGDGPLWIAEHGASTIAAIRAALRRHRTRATVAMVVIDYLQLLKAIGNHGGNRHNEISEITRQTKLMAMEEQVAVVLLSQLNRRNIMEKRAPNLGDLRESGSIEENADAVMFVWRPEVMKQDREDLHGHAEFILAKQRNGPTGMIPLVWLNQITKFENRAEDVWNSEQSGG